MTGTTAEEQFYPPNYGLSQWEYYRKKLYDREKGTFLSRNKESWAKIGLFYLIFYGMLAALVAICMWVFLQTLDPRIPKWEQDLIGTNPGLGFRPMPQDNQESTLIWLQGTDKANYLYWYDNLMEFLDKYYTPGKIEKGNANSKHCSYTEFPSPTEVCKVDVKAWEDGECRKEKFFDYYRNSPCVYLKLNKIYGWVPEYYDDPNNLPEDMPKQLKQHIRNITRPEERKNIWISCQGENPADVEYLGPVQYFPPIQGFPGYYFPYRNAERYLSPLIAVKFLRPVSGIVINVECRAWAKNIKYNRNERQGSVHFELLID